MLIGKKVYGYATALLVTMQVALILCSWIINAISPALQVKSMLSSEGIRWFFGSFAENLLTPLLAWLLLLSIAWGAFSCGGLRSALCSLFKGQWEMPYRQRYALLTVLGVLVVFVVITFLLAFVPHAILMGVTGRLFPSAFISGLFPMLAFVIVVVSVTYGIVSGVYVNVEGVFRSFCDGIISFVPLLIVYVFAIQLYSSIVFVFF